MMTTVVMTVFSFMFLFFAIRRDKESPLVSGKGFLLKYQRYHFLIYYHKGNDLSSGKRLLWEAQIKRYFFKQKNIGVKNSSGQVQVIPIQRIPSDPKDSFGKESSNLKDSPHSEGIPLASELDETCSREEAQGLQDSILLSVSTSLIFIFFHSLMIFSY